MVDGFLRLLPGARVGHVGVYRDEEEHRPVDYYERLPPGLADAHVFVVDPMLATGGSAVHALDQLKHGGRAAARRWSAWWWRPRASTAVEKAHPDVQIWTAAIDRELDENAYIRPGLGDAGDRVFGTQVHRPRVTELDPPTTSVSPFAGWPCVAGRLASRAAKRSSTATPATQTISPPDSTTGSVRRSARGTLRSVKRSWSDFEPPRPAGRMRSPSRQARTVTAGPRSVTATSPGPSQARLELPVAEARAAGHGELERARAARRPRRA